MELNKKAIVRQFVISVQLKEKDFRKFIKSCGVHDPVKVLNDLIRTVIDNPIEEDE